MNLVKTFACVFLFAILYLGPGLAQEAPLKEDSLLVDGMYRHFIHYAPEGIEEGAALLFVVHGATIDAQYMRILTQGEFEKIARRENLVIVYPNGFQGFWNGCRKEAGYAANTRDIDEVGFFRKMIDFFQSTYQIDTTRVFAAGYSNGGHLCFKLAMESPQLFRGFAVYGANLPDFDNNDCRASEEPVSILIMNGTADPINPFEGGEIHARDGRPRGRVLSTFATFDYWKSLLGGQVAEKVFSPVNTDSGRSGAVERGFKNGHYEVTLITIQNGGHTIPHPSAEAWPEFVGAVNRDINGPQLTWDFFKQL